MQDVYVFNWLRRTLSAVMLLGCACLAGQDTSDADAAKRVPAKALRFRLGLNRIDPAVVTVPPGRYEVTVLNGIVVGQAVGYAISREGEASKLNAQVAKHAVKAQSTINLKVGKYYLDVGGRTQWHAEIVVTDASSKP